MKTGIRRAVSAVAAVAMIVAILAIGGCGKKEEAVSGGNYYTGPMKPKGGGPGAPGSGMTIK